jgi:hypothetical protein
LFGSKMNIHKKKLAFFYINVKKTTANVAFVEEMGI